MTPQTEPAEIDEGSDKHEDLRSQHEAQSSYARYQELLNAMGEGLMVMDYEFRVVEINAQAQRMAALPAHDIIGRTSWEVWPACVGTPVEQAYRRAMEERITVDVTHHYASVEPELWVNVRAYPVSGGIASLLRDVTQSVEAEHALRASDARFRAAIAAIGVLWTNDASGRMTGEQPGWEQLTGQSRDDYQGYGWSSVVHPDDAYPTLDAWNLAVAERRTFIFEHRVRRRDGQWRRCAIRAVPVLDSAGGVREWVGVHMDITEAAAAAEALRTADRRKDEFLATLAHELRNPLAPIRTAAHLLGRPELSPERVAWCGDLIRRQSQIMALLLDDLLEVSRITSGRLELKKAYVSVESVIASAVETARPLIDRKHHTLAVSVPADCPLLEADPLRASQVLTNLLTNAAKYTDPQGHVELRVQFQRGEVQFDVTDNGVGLSADQMPTVFEMFHQVQGTMDRTEGGLGIGLALSKGLVELHGGRIDAFSAGPGLGARFRFTLPSGQSFSGHSVGEPSDGHGAPVGTAALTVLVADDNVDAAAALAMVLEIEGCRVELAHDGVHAFDLAMRARPQVALLDLGMPGMDGYHLATALRAQAWGGEMFLVAITGWGQEEDRRKATAAGFHEHLTKPVDPETIVELISRRRALAAAP